MTYILTAGDDGDEYTLGVSHVTAESLARIRPGTVLVQAAAPETGERDVTGTPAGMRADAARDC